METALNNEEVFIEGTDLRQSQVGLGSLPGNEDGPNSLPGLSVFPLPGGF